MPGFKSIMKTGDTITVNVPVNTDGLYAVIEKMAPESRNSFAAELQRTIYGASGKMIVSEELQVAISMLDR
jgi:hypothetical protein